MQLDEIKALFPSPELQKVLIGDSKSDHGISTQKIVQRMMEHPECTELFQTALQAAQDVPTLQSTADKISHQFTNAQKMCGKMQSAASRSKAMEWQAVAKALRDAAAQIAPDYSYFDSIPSLDLAASNSQKQERIALKNSVQHEFQEVTDLDLNALQESCKTLWNLSRTHEPSGEQCPKLVQECHETLKQMLSNPAYKLLCVNENHPLIRFVHHMAFAIFTKPDITPAYSAFYQEVMSEIPRNETDHSLKAFKEATGNIRISSAPNEERGNNSGHFFEEKIQGVELTHLIGPGKATYGTLDPVLPAVLQAIENRVLSAEPLDNDLNPFYGFIYINLQEFKIGNAKENENCKQLMQLAELYPYSLRCITMSSHTPFIDGEFDKLSGHDVEEIKKVLTDDRNFTLEQVKGKYYFPPSQKEHWKQALPKIVDLACHCLGEEVTQANKSSVFQLIKLGIARHFQVISLREFSQQKPKPENAKIASLVACLSGVDRAGHSNAGMRWALLNELNESLERFIGRAYVAHSRAPYEDHQGRLENLINTVPRDNVKYFLDSVERNALEQF